MAASLLPAGFFPQALPNPPQLHLDPRRLGLAAHLLQQILVAGKPRDQRRVRRTERRRRDSDRFLQQRLRLLIPALSASQISQNI